MFKQYQFFVPGPVSHYGNYIDSHYDYQALANKTVLAI